MPTTPLRLAGNMYVRPMLQRFCCLPTCACWVVSISIFKNKRNVCFIFYFAVVVKVVSKSKHQQQRKQDTRAQQHSTTWQHSTKRHSNGEEDTTGNQAKAPSDRATDHAAGQGHQRRNTPPEDRTRQPRPSATLKKKGTNTRHQPATTRQRNTAQGNTTQARQHSTPQHRRRR